MERREHEEKGTGPTRNDLMAAGFFLDSSHLWIHPETGDVMSLRQAREAYREVVGDMPEKGTVPTRNDLMAAGFFLDSGHLWIHPETGDVMSLQQAREAYREVVGDVPKRQMRI